MNAIALPSGFTLVRGWCAGVDLHDVQHAIAWQQTAIRLYGREVMQPRLTSWMGDERYTYSGRTHEPSPIPPLVQEIKRSVEQTTGARFNSVLANLYRDGSDSVAWHADDERELGTEPLIASLSLGATRSFKLRRTSDGALWLVTLGHGDLLVMSGRSQLDYQHSVPKTKRVVESRINLTFRQVTK